jgi:beta-lactam-binding protein with PASTA domain
VRGLKLAAASDSLRRARLAVGHIDTAYLARSSGNVSHQEPHEGSKAHAGDTVDLTLAVAPPQIPVPNVRGKTRAAAEATLKKSGFGVGVVAQVAVPGRDTTIINQDPDSGAMRNRGFLVNLVENRPPKIRRVIVPNLTGMSRAGAGDTLRRVGLVLGDVVLNDNGASPTVALQLPLPGDSAPLNSAVNVTLTSPRTRPDSTIVSDVLVRVPSVVNLTAERARRTLNDSGFTIVTMTGDTVTSAAVVDSQRPLGGDLVRANSPMLLFTTFTGLRKVPRVTGRGEDDARATAQADQYQLVVTARHRGLRWREVVDSQAPSANANARPDAVIDVRLAIPLVPPVPAAIVLSLATMGIVVRRTRSSLRKSPSEHPPKPPVEVTLTPVVGAAEAPKLSQDGGTLVRHAFTLTFSVRTDAWRVEPADTSLIKPKERTNG